MPPLKIVLWADPILKKIAEPVADSAFGQTLEDFGRQMIETMQAYNGLGLAGPQVGVSNRIFVMTFPDHKERKPLVVVNPVLKLSGATLYQYEGCLSFPGLQEQVPRSAEVVMEYQDPLEGEWNEYTLANWDARVSAHEFDHCNGVMFFDRMSRQMRKALLRQWEEQYGRTS
jgi:peptide deformylase